MNDTDKLSLVCSISKSALFCPDCVCLNVTSTMGGVDMEMLLFFSGCNEPQ